MARTVSADNLAQLNAVRSRPVLFVRLGSIRLCDWPQNLTFSSNTYTGGRLSNSGPIQEALEINAPQLDLYVDGTQSDTIGRMWQTDRTDDEVEVYEGFLTDAGALADTPMLWWSGFVLGVHLNADIAAPQQEIRCESIFSRLDRSAEFEFSPESQRRRGNTTDEFFDFARQLEGAKVGWSDSVRFAVKPRRTIDSRRFRR